MSYRLSSIGLFFGLALFTLLPTNAKANRYQPGQVVVAYQSGQTPDGVAANEPVVQQVSNIQDSLKRLRRQPGVKYVVPNLIARAAYLPNDPQLKALQWNLVDRFGVNAPAAWSQMIDRGRPGGSGVTVAVIDTGVAYSNRTPYKRSPDFTARQFVKGWDFIDDDRYPEDGNGHGTHVAGTIASASDNNVAVAGLAYGTQIMPLRVLDNYGEGNAADIAKAIYFAVRHRAQVINLSLEFDNSVKLRDIPQVRDALNYAANKGVTVVAAAGNEGKGQASYPARIKSAIAVGATTESGCLAEYSNHGRGLDIVAPGGGLNARLAGDRNCLSDANNRGIYQVTFIDHSRSHFGLPGDWEGTSMASPHVAAAAALIIADGIKNPKMVKAKIENSARDFGNGGRDQFYGAGLLDAAAALE